MNQDNKNMWIWHQVENTNPENTKEARVKGRTLTTINATSQIEQATELFGPYGKGFGIEEIQYDKEEFSNGTILLVANAIFFYYFENEKVNFPISASIKFSYIKTGNNPYLIVDDEAYKKIETDITTKALSKLGFSADIFKGMYDDNKYINTISNNNDKPKLEYGTESYTNAWNAFKSAASNQNKDALESFKKTMSDTYVNHNEIITKFQTHYDSASN